MSLTRIQFNRIGRRRGVTLAYQTTRWDNLGALLDNSVRVYCGSSDIAVIADTSADDGHAHVGDKVTILAGLRSAGEGTVTEVEA